MKGQIESHGTASAGIESPQEEPAGTTRLTAKQIYENVRVAADEEMDRPARTLFWSALAAGLIIAFSFLAAGFLSSMVSPEHRVAAAAAGYPLGFVFVVLARNQLFTENTLEPIIPLLHKPGRETLLRLLSLWAVVLAANLLGAFVVSYVIARSGLLEPSLHGVLVSMAHEAVQGSFWSIVLRAVFGGWLIALMAWLIASTKATGAQVALIWLTTAPIAAFGFRHSIAGAVEAFFAAWTGSDSWRTAVLGFLVPAIIGNIVGGVLLVALVNHGQVAPEQEAEAR